MDVSSLHLLLVHGFTQTGASWAPVVAELADPSRIRTVDLPGHGTASDVEADLSGCASLLAAKIGERPTVVVGYSLGGRVALRLALDHPEACAGLVLVGATAGIDDPQERAGRRAADGALAGRIEREGVDAFLNDWLAQPLFAGLTPEPADLAARRANTPSGLASSLRLAGTGTMDPPWWDELASIGAPVLVSWGERDQKFAALGRRIAEAIGSNATYAEIAGAGHAAHLEQPARFASQLDRFVAAVRG